MTDKNLLTIAELLAKPTLTVPEAGIVLGMKRDAAYEAARRGNIPTLKFNGKTLRVPTAQLKAMLEGEVKEKRMEVILPRKIRVMTLDPRRVHLLRADELTACGKLVEKMASQKDTWNPVCTECLFYLNDSDR